MKLHSLLAPIMWLMVGACACINHTNPSEDSQAETILRQLTLDEKLAVTHAQSRFSSPGVPRLGIPEIWWSDGPNGVRPESLWDSWDQAGWTNDSCTAYPALTALAASWNTALAGEMGRCLGEEALYRKKTVLLGPGVNLARIPTCGRNFEYMGEDPFLAGKMASAYIQGVQSQGVAASVKHFALNNQERARNRYNVHLSERALYEIYLPAFRMAVQEGKVWTVMAAYNKVWDRYCASNERLLTEILRDEWGFDGVVVSDWGAVHETESAMAGMDVEMGSRTDGLTDNPEATDYNAFHFAEPYKRKILSGEIPMVVLDNQVRRILRLQLRTNLRSERGTGRFVCPEHSSVARRVGNEGIVLLKNDGEVLPLDTAAALKILVVGENAIKKMSVGGGSSSVKAQYEIVPLEGIRSAFPLADVRFERGYVGDVETHYGGVSTGQDLSDSRSAKELLSDAVKAAADADVVLFFGGLNKSVNQDREGRDRLSYTLPYGQDELVEALAEVNNRMVFINVSGNPVPMPWIDRVPSVVQAWYLGGESGNAIADVLSGRVNPSGHLPFSWPASLSQTPFYKGSADGSLDREGNAVYPGLRQEDDSFEVYYDEGIWVGYRWYDHEGSDPLFPFGHGLSYTGFSYDSISATVRNGVLKVSVSIANTGNRAGSEVVQLYMGAPAAGEGPLYERPGRELKAFDKVELAPGEQRSVCLRVPLSEMGYYDEPQKRFVTVPGTYRIDVGSSSRDIRLSASVKVR